MELVKYARVGDSEDPLAEPQMRKASSSFKGTPLAPVSDILHRKEYSFQFTPPASPPWSHSIQVPMGRCPCPQCQTSLPPSPLFGDDLNFGHRGQPSVAIPKSAIYDHNSPGGGRSV